MLVTRYWATIWEGKPVGKDNARHVIFTMPLSTVEGQLVAGPDETASGHLHPAD